MLQKANFKNEEINRQIINQKEILQGLKLKDEGQSNQITELRLRCAEYH